MIGAVAAAAQVIGGLFLAPLLPGIVQTAKARLQGRRGASPLQPYREIRRLWSKSTVVPAGTTLVYRIAPSVVAASLAVAVLVIPINGDSRGWGLGHDMFLVVGLLAIGPFAMAIASWDTGNGFSLQGASRDLTLSIFVEGVLVLALAAVAVLAGTTNLAGIATATAGLTPWGKVASPLAALAFGFVVIAETGRQPVDNPDTHLELTMIHEGPLLEYAGRDLAYLQWGVAVRHWLMLVLAATVFLPHSSNAELALSLLAPTLVVLCLALGVVETFAVKMRLLLVPRLFAAGSTLALLSIASHLAGLQ
jgi:formate hydrogenlyase subunit 4